DLELTEFETVDQLRHGTAQFIPGYGMNRRHPVEWRRIQAENGVRGEDTQNAIDVSAHARRIAFPDDPQYLITITHSPSPEALAMGHGRAKNRASLPARATAERMIASLGSLLVRSSKENQASLPAAYR